MPIEEVPAPHRDPAVRRLLAQLGCAERSDLAIGGLALRDLVATFGSPIYAYDAQVVRSRVGTVRAALGPEVELLWSIKANPSLAITRLLREAGTGCEIASLGELAVARAAGHDARALRFAGPGKTDDELRTALLAGVGTFHVESEDEVRSLSRLAASMSLRPGVAVRVNTSSVSHSGRLRMAGAGSRFGVDEREVPGLLQRIAADPLLELRGLHQYAGTQTFEAEAFVASCRALCERAREWERQLGIRLVEIDLGGGFGVPTYLGDPTFDLERAGTLLAEVLAEHRAAGRRWIVELGRYLVAEAGVYAATVVRAKTGGVVRHLALDGGLHHCAVAAGSGSVLRRPPLLVHAGDLHGDATASESVALGGPLCTPQDQFAQGVALPPLRTGDLVAVLGVGAYGLSYSPHSFLSQPTPVEVLVDAGRAHCIRERGRPEDALRGQRDL